jgi:hypothetical protein
VRHEQAKYWFELVTPKGLKEFTGQGWENMHLFEDHPDTRRVPAYFFIDNPSRPAYVCAVPLLDGKTLFYQAWNTGCHAQAPFPGNACMHLHPHIAGAIEPGKSAFIEGSVGLFEGDLQNLQRKITAELGVET